MFIGWLPIDMAGSVRRWTRRDAQTSFTVQISCDTCNHQEAQRILALDGETAPFLLINTGKANEFNKIILYCSVVFKRLWISTGQLAGYFMKLRMQTCNEVANIAWNVFLSFKASESLKDEGPFVISFVHLEIVFADKLKFIQHIPSFSDSPGRTLHIRQLKVLIYAGLKN